MQTYVRPNTYVALRMHSGLLKVIEIVPNQSIGLGKYGAFNSNCVLGRPYHLTYELLSKENGQYATELRIVPALELHTETLGASRVAVPGVTDEEVEVAQGSYVEDQDGQLLTRNNRLTVDDASRQALSMAEIEKLKQAGAGSGREIIARIMASHKAIDEKTTFSLAKYTLRKSKKYLRRFTILPLDVGILTEYITEKEAFKIMELREDLLGLICSWANIYCGASNRFLTVGDGTSQIGGGRWLVVDETGGLVTAALAEKMGLLYPDYGSENEDESEEEKRANEEVIGSSGPSPVINQQALDAEAPNTDKKIVDDIDTGSTISPDPVLRPRKLPHVHVPQMSALVNTLTVVHSNNQPNLSYLKYFGYDSGAPSSSHPLYRNLKSLSWLSLLYPEDDPTYDEPEPISDEKLATMKPSKRGMYYRKQRRWERVTNVVDETRRGGFDGLIVATAMDVSTVLRELVPLVRGGGRIVAYHPNAEPLAELCDFYSKERRAAYVEREIDLLTPHLNGKRRCNGKRFNVIDDSIEIGDEDDDFPVNPTLLLAPSLQTVRARQWQVLPGRTHPMMTSKGGAEGYIFTGTRVLPIKGKVEARGQSGKKKRKFETGDSQLMG